MIRGLLVIGFIFFATPLLSNQRVTDPPSFTEEEKLKFDYAFMEGIRLKILEDYQSALVFFDGCIKMNPGSAAVRYEISTILLLLNNNYDVPLQLMREAVSLEPDNSWYKLLLANIFQKKSMINEACNIYKELIVKEPQREDYYLTEAELYVSVEKWIEAVGVLNRYEKQFGITEEVSIEKANLYSRSGDFKKAAAELTKLVKKNPDNSNIIGLLAELYLDNNQEKKGLNLLNRMLSKDADNGFILFYLTDYHLGKGDTLQAYQYLEKGLINDYEDNLFKVQYLLRLLVNREQLKVSPDKIYSSVLLLLDRYPEDISIRTLYVDFLRHEGKKKECKEQLEFILLKEKNNFLIWEELLVLYNELEDSVAMFEKGKECMLYFPDESLPYAMVGISLLMQKKYLEALVYFEEGKKIAFDNSPMKGQFYSYIGSCYYQMDSVSMAFEMYEEALKINPNDLLVLNNYSYYLSLLGERLDEAEQMSLKTISADPENATFLDTYAWILYKKKNYSLAKVYIHSAIEKSEEHSGTLFEHGGDILFMNGEKEKAVEMWKKALELGDEVSSELEQKIKYGIISEK